MSAHIHQGVVYFAVAGGYVKIGYSSTNVKHRLESILNDSRLKCPEGLDRIRPPRLLHVIPGCIGRDERRVQRLFAAHHVVGEWFLMTPAFLLHLAALEYVTDAEVLRNFRDARRQLKQSRTAYLGAAA